MKKALYIEAFSGISGNMLLGALIDLGADAAYIEAELKKMNLGEYELVNTRANKCGINAAYFNVKIPGVTEAAEAEEAHLHEHHDGHHCHHHAHGCEVKNIITTIMRSIIAAISTVILPKKRTNITAAMRMKQVRTIIMNTEILMTSKLSLKIQI